MAYACFFDIDGTLVDAESAHIQAYTKAYKVVLRKEIDGKKLIPHFGKPEAQIHKDFCAEQGIVCTQENISRIIFIWENEFLTYASPENIKIMPGASSFIAALRKKNYILGLFTGNKTSVGRKIIEVIGFPELLENAAFGDRFASKIEMIQKLIVDISKNHDIKRVYVIGDSVSDMIGGSANGAYCIGMHNVTSKKDLLAAGADVVVGSFEDLKTTEKGIWAK